MKPLRPVLLVLAAVLLLPRAAAAREHRIYIHEVPDAAVFELYSRTINTDRLGKFLIDLLSNEILFFDVNLYRLHADFVYGVIYKRKLSNEEIPEYNRNYEADKPRFILGYLVHHLKTDQWTFSFWEGDRIRPADIKKVYQRLQKTFFAKDLRWRPDSPLQEKLLGELKDLPTITNDKIYKAAAYQSFNNGRAVGRLRVVPPGTPYETLTFDREEIVILQETYPDISVVSGIVSTVFSTPLAHVNLRARAWNIPNAGFKDAAKKYKALAGKMVVLEVRDVDHTLRAATDAEVQAWKDAATAARTVKIPRADLATTELRALGQMTAQDTQIYGTKAANLGVIVSSGVQGVSIPAGFGVPFSMYVDHMQRSGLDKEVERILADARFAGDAAWRKAELDKLRKQILAAPINPRALDAVHAKVKKELKGKGVFVRSSTNAEDLEGFNGAGLYDTVPNVKGKAALGKALRTVWASLWNYVAVEERSFFGIDQRAVYAGVLVQVGVNATAAGVLITRNLYDGEDRSSFTINAKNGLGLRVVAGTTIPEQIIFDTSNDGTKIISRSDDPTMLVFDEHGGIKEVPNPNKGVILTEARAKALATAVRRFVPLFSPRHPLDVEWVLEGDKVWIVQARPFVSKD